MTRAFRILIALAGIMGADGVILAALSAHQADASRLLPASSMLLFHASAVLGAANGNKLWPAYCRKVRSVENSVAARTKPNAAVMPIRT